MRRGYTAERYLDRLAAARAAVDDLAVTTDLIVGFPGETEDDFERTLEVTAEAEFDSAYTFVFSPRPGTRAAAMEDRFLPAEVTAERMERLRAVVERSALRRHRARVGRVEEVVVEGPSKRDPSVTTGRTSQNKLVHFVAPDGRPPASGSYARVAVTGAARHHLTGDLVEVTARPSYRVRIPVDRRLSRGRRPGRAHRIGQVGARPGGGAAPAGRPDAGVELVSVDSMAVYRGMDVGTAKPTPEVRAEIPYHLLDLVDPDEEYTVTRFQAERGRSSPGSPAGVGRRSWWGERGCTSGRSPTNCRFRGGSRRWRSS